MNSKSLINAIAYRIAQEVVNYSTIQGRVPYLSGDLSKSITAYPLGKGEASVGSNLVYARAVHDGRPEITIVPKKAKMLAWQTGGSGYTAGGNKRSKGNKQIKWAHAKSVTQKAREGQPFLQEGFDDMAAHGFGFLDELLHDYVSAEIGEQIKDSIELNFTV